jgi:hypothetical protein
MAIDDEIVMFSSFWRQGFVVLVAHIRRPVRAGMPAANMNSRPQRFSSRERIGLTVAFCIIVGFGAIQEKRTALRREPMTDLGVFARAASGVVHGENIYNVCDWHDWHYQYPPALAILFVPLSQPIPITPPMLKKGEHRTEANTPWGWETDRAHRFYGLHQENARFFFIVAVWYVISVVLLFFSTHAVACALEGVSLREPLPTEPNRRQEWWMRRVIPIVVCIGSIGTDLSRGQVDILMLAAVAFGIYLATRGRDFGSGVWFSIPAAIKLFPPMILLYPIWRRKWRMLAGVAAGLFLMLALLPVVALGPKRSVELYRTWVEVLAKPGLGTGSDTSRANELLNLNGTDNQSLLAFIHNWRHINLPRKARPPQAAPFERRAVYVIGALMTLGIILVSGLRRADSARELCIFIGLLLGAGLVISPVAHNYYYLLALPLVAGLLDRNLKVCANKGVWKVPVILWIFMVVDFLARFPIIGNHLRDWGAPLLSLAGMMWFGASAMLDSPVTRAAEELPSNSKAAIPAHASQ